MRALETRNAVVVFVPSIEIWDLFWKLHQQNYFVPVLEDFPEDAKLRKVWYDPLRNAFGFWFEHPSFPQVKWGEEPKIRELEMKLVRTIEAKNDIPRP